MFNGLCHPGSWETLGNLGTWGWIGLIMQLALLVGLVAGLALLVVRGIRQNRASTAAVPYAASQATAKEILRAQYARGEITREVYGRRKQDIG